MKNIRNISFRTITALTILVAGVIAGNIETHAQDKAIEVEEQDLGNSNILWGVTTNLITGETHVSGVIGDLKPMESSFRCGINANNGLIIVSLKNGKVSNPAYRAVENVSTNLVDTYLPTYNEMFVITLTDTNGVAMQKTAKGRAVGLPITLKPNTRGSQARHNGYDSLPLWPKHIFMQELDPSNYFILEKVGLYKLSIVQRIYVVDTNMYLKAITLPPVTVGVRVVN